MLNSFFSLRSAKLPRERSRCKSRKCSSLLGAQELEARRLLALLNNGGAGRQEAFVSVEVNEFGAFGNSRELEVIRTDVPAGNTIGDAFYDYRDSAPPAPPIPPSSTTFESAIAIGVNFQSPGYGREFVTAGCVNYSRHGAGAGDCGDIREGGGSLTQNNGQFDQFTNPPQDQDNRTSVFYYPNQSTIDNAQIRVVLEQELIEHDRLGPFGTTLVQTYELEILSGAIESLEILRYMDADNFFPGGTPINDGGGHRFVGTTADQDGVFSTRNAQNFFVNDDTLITISEDHTSFGGFPQTPTFGSARWEVGLATGFPVAAWIETPPAAYVPPDNTDKAEKPRAFPISQASPYLIARIMDGAPLANQITVDGDYSAEDFNGNLTNYGTNVIATNFDSDDDGIIDLGEAEDVALALSNRYVEVNIGDRIVYQVRTTFGNPPIGAVPPPPTTAFINGTVFTDLNGDGIQDPTELGAAGRTVFDDRDNDGVVDPGEAFDVTGADGSYTLQVPTGTYNIALAARANFTQTLPIGTGTTAPGSYAPVVVVAGDLGTDIDPTTQGFTDFNFGTDPAPSTIFGTVWNDENANQIFDASESPLASWPVFVDINNDGIQQLGEVVVTDATGRYQLDNLNPGTYTIRSTPQPTYEETFPGDSEHTITIGAGANTNAGNFGFRFIRGSISGTKFHDLNGNGTRESGEPPLSDVLIYLDLSGDGILNIGDRSSRTDSQGRWRFDDVQPNILITVAESLPLGVFQTAPTTDGGTFPVTLAPGEMLAGLEFGNRFITVDYGDAPAPFPTSIQLNGAAHEFDPDIRLGATVTAEATPAINATATGDSSDDGVTLVGSLAPGATGTIQVVASQPGFLQGWIDFTGNSSWADAGEQIFLNRPLIAGTNTLMFAVPATAVPGTTFARFRFGTEMNIGLTGLASDGEVEDYQYTITGSGTGVPTSWTNPVNSFDVDNDGNVGLSDALAIVSDLRANGSRTLPTPTVVVRPPPFLDVNGDGRATISDAIDVIRRIIIIRAGGPEGESEVIAKSSDSLSAKVSSTDVTAPLSLDSELDAALLSEMAAANDAANTGVALPSADDDDQLGLDLDSIAADISAQAND